MKSIKSLFCLSLIVILLTGCTDDDQIDITEEGTAIEGGNAATSGYADGSGIKGVEIQGMGPDGTLMEGSMMGSNATLMGGEFANPNSPLSKQVIYFQYDSSEVLPEFIEVINAHAQYLSTHTGQQVILEGHADERGSPEYNIALSEQRSKSVARAVAKQGVSGGQLELVSYGEEKPAAFEHDEVAYQQNRRVEIIYKSR